MADPLHAVAAWSVGVSTVSATFAGIVASRATTPLSQNPWFVTCLVIAIITFVVLLITGILGLIAWWGKRWTRPVPAAPTPPARAANHGSNPSRQVAESPAGVPAHQVWNIPTRNLRFTGRDEILESMRDRLLSSDQVAMQVIRGIGGIGKTQLATEYAHRFNENYDIVWWIAAGQEGLIGDQLAELAGQLGCADRGADTPVMAQAVMVELRNRSRWLLIFDDADNPADIASWLPSSPTGHVLITSRGGGWEEIAHPFSLREFDRVESTGLIRGQIPSLTAVDADRLAEALGDLPLGVAQATQYLANTQMSADEYLRLLSTRASEIMSEGQLPSYQVSLAAATSQTFNQLTKENPAAAQLAALCAFLSPEPVPIRIFTVASNCLPDPLTQSLTDPLTFRRMLLAIDRLGLARLDGGQLQMHRLTQVILRDHVVSNQPIMLRTVESMLVANEPGDPADPANWPEWMRLLSHLLAVSLVTTSDDRFRDLICRATLYLLVRGDTHAALRVASRLQKEWQERLGIDNRHTLWASCNLAEALRRMGRFTEAGPLYEDLLVRARSALGPDHILTLRIADGFAINLHQLGKVEEARTMLEDTLRRRRRLLGADHPDTLTSATNLANNLSELGELRRARELHEGTLSRRRRVLGNDHLGTLRTAVMLAKDLQDLGEGEAARTLGADTLRRMRTVLGEAHPDTLVCAGNLAIFLQESGEVGAARALNEDTLPRMRTVLGDDHPDTLRTATYLVVNMIASGETPPTRDALATFEVFAERMSDNGEFLSMWAFCIMPSDPEKALELLDRALSLGMTHDGVIIGNKLYCLRSMERYTRGIIYASEIYDDWDEIHGERAIMWSIEDNLKPVRVNVRPYIIDVIESIALSSRSNAIQANWKDRVRDLRGR